MKILFDQGTPLPLRVHLSEHQVSTAYEMGWSRLSNGELLAAAEALFDLLISTDQNLQYQQDLSRLRLAIVILPTTSWPEIRKYTQVIADQVSSIEPGQYHEIRW